MKGLTWCIGFVVIGVPMALLGIAVDAPRVMAVGGGLVATVVVGWPLLVLMGAVDEGPRRR